MPYLDAASGAVMASTAALSAPHVVLVSVAGGMRFFLALVFAAGAVTLAILLRRDTQYRQRHIEVDADKQEQVDGSAASASAASTAQDAVVMEHVVRCTIHVTGLPLRSAAYHRTNAHASRPKRSAAAESKAHSAEEDEDWVHYFRSLVAAPAPTAPAAPSNAASGLSSAASSPQHPHHHLPVPRASLTLPPNGSPDPPHAPLTPNQPHAFFDSHQPRRGSLVAAIPLMAPALPDSHRSGAVMVAPSAPGSCATTPRGGAGSFASLPSAAVPGADRGLAISVASTPRLLTPPHGFVSGSSLTPPHHSALHKLRNISPSRFLHHSDAAPAEDPIIAAAHVAHDLTAVQELLRKRCVAHSTL